MATTCLCFNSAISTLPQPLKNTAPVVIKRQQKKKRGKLAATPAPGWKPLNRTDLDSVEHFLIFMGWPRSCHSIIGSMLDAHPNVIVAHEYFLFNKLVEHPELVARKLLYNQLYNNSYANARKGWRTTKQTRKGYSLSIDRSWQGKFTTLKVIGDKCGGDVTRMYHKNSAQLRTVYRMLKANVKVPIKVLQVVRNPFDMIATMALYRGSGVQDVKVNATKTHKYSDARVINGAIKSVFDMSKMVMRIVPDLGLSPLEVHCEDLIADPAKTLSDICRFLDLECPPDYLQMCVDKTFKTVSESRHTVDWDPNTLLSLINNVKKIPFFHRYSFYN